jgi:3-hydroxyacyl-[acyl-carrier-protein] dehydratase
MPVEATAPIGAAEFLNLLPQTAPFRFVDRVLEIDEKHVVAEYRFTGEEFFYAGHFPGDPVTPGVILAEAMAQGGVALQALYLIAQEFGPERATRIRTVLTEIEIELLRPVIPPQTITICGELILYRARKIRSLVKMLNERGEVLATAKIAGMGVPVA